MCFPLIGTSPLGVAWYNQAHVWWVCTCASDSSSSNGRFIKCESAIHQVHFITACHKRQMAHSVNGRWRYTEGENVPKRTLR